MKSTSLRLTFLCFLLSGAIQAQDPKPNIIFIIADDMGWNQVSSNITNNVDSNDYGSDFYETPVIDQLAMEGIAFPFAYVNGANCAPTRAAILSGQFAAREHNNVFTVDQGGQGLNRGNDASNSTLIGPEMGLENNLDEIPSTAITIGETLQAAGYTTAHFGKYHVGGNENGLEGTPTENENAPTEQGFDVNFGGGTDGGPGGAGSGGGYFAYANTPSTTPPYYFGNKIGPELDVYAAPYSNNDLSVNSVPLAGTSKHVTDALTEAAIGFMDDNNDTPFFMHFSNYAIHGPYNTTDARPDLRAKYEAKAISNPGLMDHNTTPGQAALAEGMDQSIGRLIDYLRTTPDPRNGDKPLSENTIVYFISDNGDAVKRTPQAPLRGMKGEYYEGGIRSVTFAWTEPADPSGNPTYTPLLENMGEINFTPIVAFDLYPTFVEAAGGTLPGGGYDIDGESQWQMLTEGTDMTRESLYWHHPGYLIDNKRDSRPVTVVRKGKYKLMHFYEDSNYEMYDLEIDISEGNNLLPSTDSALIDIANDMIADMLEHLNETSAPLPTYRPEIPLIGNTTVPLPNFINSPADCQVFSGFDAFWDFDLSSDDRDVSINGHDPELVNGSLIFDNVDFKEGDRSAYFDGSTNIKYSNGTFLNDATSARTVMVWVKPNALSGIQNLFDEGGGSKGIVLRLNGSNIESIVRSSSTVSNSLSTSFPSDGDWHHVAFVYDGASGNQKIYIDGSLISTGVAPSTVGTHSGAGGIAGILSGSDSFGNSGNANFIGNLDAFAIYNLVLNDVQIEDSSCSDTLTLEPENSEEIGLIFPNPFQNEVNIKLKSTSNNIILKLYDITGKEILYRTFNNTDFINIPVNNLSEGIYIIKLKVDNSQLIKKILKN